MRVEYTCGTSVLEREINEFYFEMHCANKEEVINEINRLNNNKHKVHKISTEETIELLDKCAKMWLNRDYSREHIERLSRITNQSFELVAHELEGSMAMLLRENIEKTIVEELGNKEILDKWVSTSYGAVHRQPRGLTFHNISGNAFVVIPVSISMGLLSKNCNLVKVSADEPYFAYAFYKSLCEIDSSIKDRLSVLYFDSSESSIYETIVSKSNCVVHWGGEYSGRIMSDLCSKYQAHLIMHGAKISFEVIEEAEAVGEVAEQVAKDIVFWEQKACLSPRIAFVNKELDVKDFAIKLAKSLEQITNIFPKAYLSPWDSVKTIQDRQYCLLKYGIEEEKGAAIYSSFNADYTVILNSEMPDSTDIDRCFHRFIFVCPYESKNEVYDYIEKNLRDYLQTMGYSGNDEEFIEDMTLLGVSIVTRPGEMPIHYPGTSHDGIHNLYEMTFGVSKQL